MTAVAGHVTSGPASPALLQAGAPGLAGMPRLTDGVELLGEYKDSGYSRPRNSQARPGSSVPPSRAMRPPRLSMSGTVNASWTGVRSGRAGGGRERDGRRGRARDQRQGPGP